MSSDLQELEWFFSLPTTFGGAAQRSVICAQTYEPGGSGYDPFVDERLVRLVDGIGKRDASEWSRIRRVLDELPASRVEVLRLAFSPRTVNALPEKEFRFGEVACACPTALDRGRHAAIEHERMLALEAIYHSARAHGCSGPVTAMRVFEADAQLTKRPPRVDDGTLRYHARRALERAIAERSREVIDTVREEMISVVEAATDAYREMRASLGASHRAERARRRRDAEQLLDRLLGAKRRRETARYEARLRRSA